MSDTTAKVWETLKEAYGTVSDLGANSAENTLRVTKYSDGMDFQKHITNLCSKWNAAVEKGADVKDNQFRAIVISSLPASWDYIIASLQSTKTLVDLIAGLNVHWERVKEWLAVNAGATSTALLAKAHSNKENWCAQIPIVDVLDIPLKIAIGVAEGRRANSC